MEFDLSSLQDCQTSCPIFGNYNWEFLMCHTVTLRNEIFQDIGQCLQNLRLQNFVIFLDHGMILICPRKNIIDRNDHIDRFQGPQQELAKEAWKMICPSGLGMSFQA